MAKRIKEVLEGETPEETARLDKAYAESRKKYTYEYVHELYSREEKMVPFEDVIRDLKQLHRELTQKRKKKKA